VDRLTLLLLGALVVAPAALPAPAVGEPAGLVEQRLDRWQPLVAEAAARFHIPEAWIRAVMKAESGGRTRLDGRPITSRAGAMGLMQVMPETYAELRLRHGLGPDPHGPRDNILAGTAYLREMYDRFGFPGLFAAYNAGPGRYQEHLDHGRPLPAETRAYLVALDLPRLAVPAVLPVARGSGLFFLREGDLDQVTEPSLAPSAEGLFVPLRGLPEGRR